MSKSIQELNQKIQQLLQSKEPLQALTLCEEALQSFPNNIYLHLNRAQALINLEKIVPALEHLLGVQEKFQQNKHYLCKLGQLYLRQQELIKAKECFESSSILDSEHQPTLNGLSTVASRELSLKLDEIEELMKVNNEKAEYALLTIYEEMDFETIKPFAKNKMTRLIKESKSVILFEKSLQLVTSKPETLTEKMLSNLIQLALNLKKIDDAEQLYKHFKYFTTINYHSAMTALKTLLKSDSDTFEQEVKQIQNKLHKTDAILFEIQVLFKIEGALQAYVKLKELLTHEEINTHINTLIPVFRNAGKAKEALTVLEESLTLEVIPLQIKTAYLNTLMQMGNYQKAFSFLDQNTSPMEIEPPLIRIKLTLWYHLGEYAEVIHFLQNNQSEVVSNENILIWSLFESGEILSLEQITHWAQILQLDKKTRKERTLHIHIFEDTMLQLQNANAKQYIFSNAAILVTQHYTKHLSSEKNSEVSQIAKSIVQYWDEKIPPPYIEQITATFSSIQGYEHKLFSKRETLSYIRENFDRQYMRAFQLCKHPAEQADYFRLLYLSKNGGIYVDCDDIFTDDIDTLLSYDEGLILYKEPFGVGNNFLACKAGHPVLLAALQRATQNLRAKTQENIWFKTGPGLLISVLSEYLTYVEQNSLEADVRILSREKVLQSITPHSPLPYKDGKKSWLSTLQSS